MKRRRGGDLASFRREPTGVQPAVVDLRVGDKLTISSQGRDLPTLAAPGKSVVGVDGATIQALRPGTATVAAVRVDYCAPHPSEPTTCDLVTVHVES